MSAFETVIRLRLEQFSPEAAKRQHIAIARAGLGAFLAAQSARPGVTIETDGHAAASEEQVRPFGVITYRFQRMREIVAFALGYARSISPVDSGRYRDAWFALLGGSEIAVDAIPDGETILISNDEPYARKIHTGAKGFEAYVPPGIVEKVRQAVLARYKPIVEANLEFITLEGGYVLKKALRSIHNGRRYGGIRNDSRAGTPITYPSLSLTPKR